MSTAPRQRFLVFAPDKTEEGTFEQRMSVRPKHLERAKASFANGLVRVGGAVLSPESVATPDAPKKMIGSAFICEADNIEQVWEYVKSDVYYTDGVWDTEKLTEAFVRTVNHLTGQVDPVPKQMLGLRSFASTFRHLRSFHTSNKIANKYFVYAPDYPNNVAHRYAVREEHLAGVKKPIDTAVAGMLVNPEQPKIKIGDEMRNNATGSILIIEADTLEEAKELIERDVYWKKGVWDKERINSSPVIIGPIAVVTMAHYISRASLQNPLRLSNLARTRWTITFATTTSAATRAQYRKMSSSANANYEYIVTSRPEPNVLLIQLNRPKALNALCSPLFKELNQALRDADRDDSVGAMVLTGSEKAFAAGADIKEMKDKQFADVYKNRFLEDWADMTKISKPIIAAVSGYALGGGCELALMCDIILASPTAKFGQPEINLGVIPGGGGSQRLAQLVGKSRAMEMVLTGRMITAQEADKWGMISGIVGEGEGQVVKDAIAMAKVISEKSQIAVQAAKEVVNEGMLHDYLGRKDVGVKGYFIAYETTLTEGLKYERRIFHGLFATNDQKEGMSAFAEKRKANFTHS
ncbi:hypothetical protein NP233_g4929 [Leucocoprinus birnbaumii]|uniref:Probable enoyl-CoA hydratase, mitochondrial n=1 Tax=Leucocoprinus birnbaumii TaxID=56174 RepID=A0AAD5YRE4_9AGAR|nr:hypothetical protein NP233_g4929 [Leucocoprinus birnbaumii]